MSQLGLVQLLDQHDGCLHSMQHLEVLCNDTSNTVVSHQQAGRCHLESNAWLELQTVAGVSCQFEATAYLRIAGNTTLPFH
jgi:hypothetical protein